MCKHLKKSLYSIWTCIHSLIFGRALSNLLVAVIQKPQDKTLCYTTCHAKNLQIWYKCSPYVELSILKLILKFTILFLFCQIIQICLKGQPSQQQICQQMSAKVGYPIFKARGLTFGVDVSLGKDSGDAGFFNFIFKVAWFSKFLKVGWTNQQKMNKFVRPQKSLKEFLYSFVVLFTSKLLQLIDQTAFRWW